MKKLTYYLLMLLVGLLAASCNDSWDVIDDDPGGYHYDGPTGTHGPHQDDENYSTGN